MSTGRRDKAAREHVGRLKANELVQVTTDRLRRFATIDFIAGWDAHVAIMPERETLVLAVARTMGGWNDDTSEPTILDATLREAAEAYWHKVNAQCLKDAGRYVDAMLALLNGKGDE